MPHTNSPDRTLLELGTQFEARLPEWQRGWERHMAAPDDEDLADANEVNLADLNALAEAAEGAMATTAAGLLVKLRCALWVEGQYPVTTAPGSHAPIGLLGMVDSIERMAAGAA